jgi:hypothetical protein
MPKMVDREIIIIEDYFVRAGRDSRGRLYPLSFKGKFVLDEFKNNWLDVQVPDGYYPRVCVGPAMTGDGAEGYLIRKEIVSLGLVTDEVRTTP